MRHTTSLYSVSTRQYSFSFHLLLAAGLIAGALVASSYAGRAEDMSYNAQLLNSRLAGQASDGLHAYARRVEALAHDLGPAQRTNADAAATREDQRMVWLLSLLHSSGSASEIDELDELQQMLSVYRGMHRQVAAAARAGDRPASVREAMKAAAVADEIHASLRRLEGRNYSEFYAKATRLAAVDSRPAASR